MGQAREAEPVKLITSIFLGDLSLLTEAKAMLTQAFGPIDFESQFFPFAHTDYYAAEFGTHLVRQIVTFQQLMPPADLPTIKGRTNGFEQSLSKEGKRRVDIDPGYVSLGKLVLASTKDHAHRLYLAQGIYGEVTLTFQRGRFRPWPWTYPDYASDEYCALFDTIRARYKAQLRTSSGTDFAPQ
jgi:hypothetical protein